ncbi:hypothetical protein [Rhodococcus sp. X156]|uniref:hypothetical protein n=1 Tax=Rhodococcus sp. X156 TaxID=2499145 RepID=UPI000FDC3441|nr:hypothetical protein [Rhodococcus sp. X156]
MSKLEAVTRISALAGAAPEKLGPGSKERKSALVGLAGGLGLTVDLALPKPGLAAEIASQLEVEWTPECWSTGDTITLAGLNALLVGAEREREKRRQKGRAAPPEFVAARSKLEAVTRISALFDGPPESLGPGSKERKSALLQLVTGLQLEVDQTLAKPALGAAIATRLGASWTDTCWSAGHTITLEGLNTLLEAAERQLGRRNRGPVPGVASSPRHEAEGILEALALALPAQMVGRDCVERMREAEYSQWAQDEWAGFFLEFVGIPACINAFGGQPAKYENTTFDYALGQVWDFKLHAASTGVSPLNAVDGVVACLKEGKGLGFIVLSGEAQYDDGAFRQWQRDQRATAGKVPARRAAPPRYARRSKHAFTPRRLEAYFITNESVLGQALEEKVMSLMRQGNQASGAPRKPKFSLNLAKARSSPMLLASRDL